MAYGSTGTGISQPSAQALATANALTAKIPADRIYDQVFKPSPAYWALNRNGTKKRTGELIWPLVTGEDPAGGAFYGDQLLDTSVPDILQPANQVWRFYQQAISIPVTDIILNAGEGSVPLIKARYEIAAASLLQKLSRALWGTAPQNTALDLDNIVNWVGTTNNLIAGINRASNAFWNPTTAVPGGGVNLTPAIADQAYYAVTLGNDQPDLMLFDNTRYIHFKANFTANTRYTNAEVDTKAVQAGFRMNFLFNNAVVLPDTFVPSGTGWVLNTKYLFPVFHQDLFFVVNPFLMPTNQEVIVSRVKVGMQLACVSPRMQVEITGIT